MKTIRLWCQAMRARFFVTAFIAVMVGAAVSHSEQQLHWGYFLLALLVVVASQAGANMINDFFDALGSDRINQNHTPFNGGSRLIQLGVLNRSQFLAGAIWAYAISLMVALGLAVQRHNSLIFWVALVGALLGIAYSARPTFGMGRVWGELATGIGFGPLAVLGSYMVQTEHFAWKAMMAGVPVGFMIMGVLLLNQIPDYEADRQSNKRTWVVRSYGCSRGLGVYMAVITLAYLAIFIGVITGILPPGILISYASIPLAVWVVLKTWCSQSRVPEMLPALAGNIGLSILTGLLLSIGLWWR